MKLEFWKKEKNVVFLSDKYTIITTAWKKNSIQKDEKVFWKCLNCGHIHEGEEAPVVCPTCIHPQGYFEVFVEAY